MSDSIFTVAMDMIDEGEKALGEIAGGVASEISGIIQGAPMAPEDELGEGVDTISNSPVVGEAQAVEQGEGLPR